MSSASTSAWPEPIHPIVLVHGLLGFATLGVYSRLEYFRGIMRHLENNPAILRGRGKVYVADLDPTDTIPSRAIQLRDFIQSKIYDDERQAFRFEKVNIIAHSMGGLDARYLVANLSMDTGPRRPMADCVASLTTIGTPHQGTPFADDLLQLRLGKLLVDVAGAFNFTVGAFDQLTVRFLERFNQRMPDRAPVAYFSYAGRVPIAGVFPPLLPSAVSLFGHGVDNDGIVPVDSAIFRYPPLTDENDQVLAADHAAQIGHGYAYLPAGPLSTFDHLDFYTKVADALDRRGLYFAREPVAAAG